MKVAFFLSSLSGGGAERMTLHLAEVCVRRGLEVDLVVVRDEGELSAMVPTGVRLVNLAARHAWLSTPSLALYLRRERPIAIMSSSSHVNCIAVWARLLARVRMRLVISERNALRVRISHTKSWRATVLPIVMRWTYPWADEVVAVSTGVADELAQTLGMNRDRISVIYNPTVTPELLVSADQPCDHPWFNPGSPPVILTVGRLTEQKDHSVLIHAFAMLRRTRKARLMILGEGSLRGRLEALVRELNVAKDVTLPGFKSNPHAYMKRAAMFVLSSAWEGFPNVLVEAMALGIPVVSTNCPHGAAEILAQGQWGLLTPVGDLSALATAMEKRLDSPGPNASQRAMEFNAEDATDRYLELMLPGKQPTI